MLNKVTQHINDGRKLFRKVSTFFLKPISRNIFISVVILGAALILVTYTKQPQIFTQFAATTPQGTSQSCNSVPFYCLVMGGSKQCNEPSVCVASQSAAFVATSSASQTIPNKLIIHFDFNSAVIKSNDQPALDQLAAILKQFPKDVVTITGYTDSIGSTGANQIVAAERAQAAANYLQSKVGSTSNNTNKYILGGCGAADPVAPNTNPDGSDNPAGRAQNRRAEITVNTNTKPCPGSYVLNSSGTGTGTGTGTGGSGNSAPVNVPGNLPPSNNDCGTFYRHYMNMTPGGVNYGDPTCTLIHQGPGGVISENRDLISSELTVLKPSEEKAWFFCILPNESGYNANAYLGASTSGQGAYGLVQMNPAGKGNGKYDVGNVVWTLQLSNGINYNDTVIGHSFRYWPSSYDSCIRSYGVTVN